MLLDFSRKLLFRRIFIFSLKYSETYKKKNPFLSKLFVEKFKSQKMKILFDKNVKKNQEFFLHSFQTIGQLKTQFGNFWREGDLQVVLFRNALEVV